VGLYLVDLSLPICDRMPTYAFNPKTVVMPHVGIRDAGYNMHQLLLCTHLGTHIDAPYHFIDEALTIDKIDLRKCIGLALVVDLTCKGPKEEIVAADLDPYKGALGSRGRMILRTGWDKRFPSVEYFTDHPALTMEACAWMIEQGIECLAMDIPSTHPNKYAETHRMLLGPGSEMVLVEGLRGLERLKGAEVLLIAFPLAIEGCDGSPCRAVAIDGDVASLAEDLESLAFFRSGSSKSTGTAKNKDSIIPFEPGANAHA
jgi:arylformamidase